MNRVPPMIKMRIGLQSHRSLRDGFLSDGFPGNKLPGYYHSIPPGWLFPARRRLLGPNGSARVSDQQNAGLFQARLSVPIVGYPGASPHHVHPPIRRFAHSPIRSPYNTAVMPPSMYRICPFTNEEASLLRKTAAPTSSDGRPQRFAGVRCLTQASNSGLSASTWVISVMK